MKVLLISVRSDFGGGPRHVNQLVDNMPAEVELYLAYPEGGEPYGIIWDNNSRIKGRVYIPYRRFSLKALFALKKFIIENRIDIVHSHGNGAGVYSRMLRLIGLNVKVMHTFHGITDNYSSRLKKFLNISCGRIFKTLTDVFVLVSYGELQLGLALRILENDRAVVIYNGIEEPKEDSLKRKGLNIITLSRFDYQKNMDLCYSIASNFKKNPEIRFVWVGDGEDFERLKAQSKKEATNIDFIGFSETPMKYLCSSTIYLSSSRFEGLPYALIEAAAVGLPIVATDVKGNNEVVKHAETGYLYKTKEEACNYINSLVENEALLARMSSEAKKFYKQKFTLNAMIEKIVTQYNSLLNK